MPEPTVSSFSSSVWRIGHDVVVDVARSSVTTISWHGASLCGNLPRLERLRQGTRERCACAPCRFASRTWLLMTLMSPNRLVRTRWFGLPLTLLKSTGHPPSMSFCSPVTSRSGSTPCRSRSARPRSSASRAFAADPADGRWASECWSRPSSCPSWRRGRAGRICISQPPRVRRSSKGAHRFCGRHWSSSEPDDILPEVRAAWQGAWAADSDERDADAGPIRGAGAVRRPSARSRSRTASSPSSTRSPAGFVGAVQPWAQRIVAVVRALGAPPRPP